MQENKTEQWKRRREEGKRRGRGGRTDATFCGNIVRWVVCPYPAKVKRQRVNGERQIKQNKQTGRERGATSQPDKHNINRRHEHRSTKRQEHGNSRARRREDNEAEEQLGQVLGLLRLRRPTTERHRGLRRPSDFEDIRPSDFDDHLEKINEEYYTHSHSQAQAKPNAPENYTSPD